MGHAGSELALKAPSEAVFARCRVRRSRLGTQRFPSTPDVRFV